MYQLHSLNQKRNCLRICIQSEAAELHSAVRSSLSPESQKLFEAKNKLSILFRSSAKTCSARTREFRIRVRRSRAHTLVQKISSSKVMICTPLREERTWSKTIDTSLLSYCTSKYINPLKFIPLSYVGLMGLMPTSTLFLLNLISKYSSLSIDI